MDMDFVDLFAGLDRQLNQRQFLFAAAADGDYFVAEVGAAEAGLLEL